MEWFTHALLASALWAVAVIVDKFVLTHHIKDAFSYQIVQIVTWIPPVFVLFICASFRNVPLFYLTILVIGMVLGMVFVLYNKALLIEEVSRVIPLFYISPLFVLLLSTLFLDEGLTVKRYIGIGLMVFSAISVSLRRTEATILSPALFMILFLDLIIAGKDVIAKFLFTYMDFWTYLFWFGLGNIVGRPFLLLIPGTWRNFIGDMKTLSRKIVLLCFINSALVCAAYVLYFSAVSMTYVSLVSAIPSTQPFLVFLFATALGVFYPDSIREGIERKGMVTKGIAVTAIITGSYLIVW